MLYVAPMRTGGALVIALWLATACGKKSSSNEGTPPEQGSAAKTTDGTKPPKEPPMVMKERWAASIAAGAKLIDFVVVFEKKGDAWTAQLEGVTKTPLPLAKVELTADHIAYTLEKPANPAANEVYDLKRAGDVAEGTSTIGGGQIPAKMVKLADGAEPHSAYDRPQTPKGPFPYDTRDVEVPAPDGGTLAGTLTLPKGATAPVAAVLLWSGSGQQDRDESIYGHHSFLLVADKLTRAGIATVRFDDRGTGKTKGAIGTLYTEIDDAGAAIDWLKTQKEIDPKRVGMIGHSTGGMVVANVALKHPLAFIVSLAGVAVTGRELVILQADIAAQKAGGTGMPPEARAIQKAIGEAAIKNPDEVKKILTDAVTKQYEAAGRKPTPEEIEGLIAKPVAEATNPWTVSYFKIDPRDAWKKLTVPTLLVVGDLDTQVPADVTIEALTKSHAKPEVVTTKKVPGLNHLFQHAKTGLSDEYIHIDETFDTATLDAIASWVTEHSK